MRQAIQPFLIVICALIFQHLSESIDWQIFRSIFFSTYLYNGCFSAQLRHFRTDVICLVLEVGSCQRMHSAMTSMSSSLSPRVVTAGVPIRTPEVTNGLLGSFGTVFLFRVMYTSSQRFCGSLPEISMPRRSTNIRWLSVPPVRILNPCFRSAAASAAAFFFT